jgi:hypothetical protein
MDRFVLYDLRTVFDDLIRPGTGENVQHSCHNSGKSSFSNNWNLSLGTSPALLGSDLDGLWIRILIPLMDNVDPMHASVNHSSGAYQG